MQVMAAAHDGRGVERLDGQQVVCCYGGSAAESSVLVAHAWSIDSWAPPSGIGGHTGTGSTLRSIEL